MKSRLPWGGKRIRPGFPIIPGPTVSEFIRLICDGQGEADTMACVQLVAVAPSLEKTGEVTKVTAYTSDLIELVSGVSPVSRANTSCKLV